MKISHNLEDVKELSKVGNVIPIYTKILADVETPISAYLKIAENEDYSFILESVSGEDKFARYTFIGCDPYLRISAKNNYVTINKKDEIDEFKLEDKTPLYYLEEIMKNYKPVNIEELPNFIGGAVGYFGYDMVRHFEKIPDDNLDIVDVPEMYYMLTDKIIAFDRFKQELILIVNIILEENDDVEQKYKQGVKDLENLYKKINKKFENLYLEDSDKEYSIKSNFENSSFCNSVDKAKEYIKSGDIFQVVLSQRFYTDYNDDPFNAYRRLRSINPSPYMFYIDFKDFKVAGASPEILVRVEKDNVILKPIAGTRKRGKTIAEDMKLEKELLEDEKEIAEHVMLIDLGRNDVGRVSEYGTVKLTEKMIVEKYSHVMHIVSSVEGKLEKDKTGFDALKAVFPAGTLTGAPKIRAMEIIEELEPEKRGIYGGAIGYFSFNGDLDSCITIRSIVFKDDKAYMQAGAGIVYDSVPEREFEETENKIAAVIRALN